MRERLRRWGFRAAACLLGAGALYYLFLAGEYSALDVRTLERERDRTAVRVDSVRHHADSLLLRADSLRSDPLAIERAAREGHGLIRDGERVYRFVEPGGGRGAAAGETGRREVDAPATAP